jgi:hypothetical protein
MSVFQGFPHIPDYRLRAVVRTFIKSLINKCPHRYFPTVVAPLLHQVSILKNFVFFVTDDEAK